MTSRLVDDGAEHAPRFSLATKPSWSVRTPIALGSPLLPLPCAAHL